jgi:DNA-binding XRE family transcriptional regulator
MADIPLEPSSTLRAWRSRMNLSQEEAAAKLRVSIDTYRSYENRRRPVPDRILAFSELMERQADVRPSLSVDAGPVHVFGGGTVSHVRNHLAMAAIAYGTTARQLAEILHRRGSPPVMHLTRMADTSSKMETNADVSARLDTVIADPEARIVFFNPAMVDFDGTVGGVPGGRKADRLRSADGAVRIDLVPADKVVSRARRTRKDLFVVAFKTTTRATPDEQYRAGLDLLKRASVNLVLANDVVTRLNMVIVPEEARYHETMALLRSTNTFTRSTVRPGDSVPWTSDLVPENLRQVVDHAIARGAYKPFRGATVGHFAARVDSLRIVTSKRKHDFNRLAEEGMVMVESSEPDSVIAYGAKPSVGGMSQRIIFSEHDTADCIVHFHCPLRPDAPDEIPLRDQRPYECGSHECGRQTSRGLASFGDIKAVMLDEHGPNIVFGKKVPAADVIAFIERNFDLTAKTGGMVS